MPHRTAHLLLLAAGILLLTQLFRAGPTPSSARADETGTVPKVLRAQTIELVDERGKTRASLKTEPGGDVVLRMMDAKGTIRVKLGAAEDGSGLLLLDDRAEPGVHVLAKRGGTSLTLAEHGKETRVLKP